MKKRVLCLAADGFEEIELITPVDVLRRAEVEVTIASIGGKSIKGKTGVVLEADAILGEETGDYDLLLIPGGPGVGELRRDGRSAALAREFSSAGKTVAAICAAPLVLADAGLLEGKRFTAHFSVKQELDDTLDERLVVDGNVVTSRGAGTALEFGLELVERLVGRKAREEVSEAIMV